MQQDFFNPQDLQPEQFGGPDGYRLLTQEEAAVLMDPESAKTYLAQTLREVLRPELYHEGACQWQRVTRTGRLQESFTYRTAAPLMEEETACPASMPYPQFVESLLKDGGEIMESLTPEKVALWHLGTLLSGEAGELLDAIKKHVVYNKPIDLVNVHEELGDLSFALTALLDFFGFTREEVEEGNRAKLMKRFPQGAYSDRDAQRRADKEEESPDPCLVCGGPEPCSHDFDAMGKDLEAIGAKMGTANPS